MVLTTRLVFLVLAAITFALAAAVVPTRINLTALGLLFLTIAAMV